MRQKLITIAAYTALVMLAVLASFFGILSNRYASEGEIFLAFVMLCVSFGFGAAWYATINVTI